MSPDREGRWEWSRWIRSAAVASLWGAGAFFGVILALNLLAGGTSWGGLLREAVWAVPLYLLASLALTGILSLAGHALLNVAGWAGLPAFLAVGACPGAAAGGVLVKGSDPSVMSLACAFAGAGAAWGYHRSYYSTA